MTETPAITTRMLKMICAAQKLRENTCLHKFIWNSEILNRRVGIKGGKLKNGRWLLGVVARGNDGWTGRQGQVGCRRINL